MLDTQTRKLLVKVYEKLQNADDVGEIFGVSRRTVFTYVSKARKGESLEVRTSERGRKSKVTDQDREAIKNCIQEKPDITIHEINEKLKLPVGDEEVRRIVVKMGFKRKKKSIHAFERERPRCSGKTERVENADKDA